MTTSQLVEIRAGLEALIDKVTLEPWVAESGDVWTGETGRHGIPILRGDRGHDRRWGRPISEEEAEAIVNYVAGCHPANTRTLLNALAAVERERDELAALLNEGGTWEAQLSAAEARATAAETLNAELVEGLKPFGDVGRVIDGPFGPALFADDADAFQSGCAWSEDGVRKTLTWGDFRRARSLIQKGNADG